MSDWASLAVGAANGAIGASSSIFNTIANIGGNYLNTYLDWRLQQEAINRQNAYNSPASQMARYKEAGLNPQLIYGQGQSSSGNQQSSITPHLSPWNMNLDLGDALHDSIQTYLQMKQVNAQVHKTESEAGVAEWNQKVLAEQWERYRRENFFQNVASGLPTDFLGDSKYVDALKSSPSWSKYSSEVQTAKAMANYYQARNTIEELDAKQRSWVLNNRNRLEEEYFKLRNKGLSQDNALHKIRLDLNETLKSIGGETGANLIWKVVSFLLQNAVIMGSTKY